MSVYRLYLVDRDGGFADVQCCRAGTDDQALEAADGLLMRWPAVEVWDGGRFVGKRRAAARTKAHARDGRCPVLEGWLQRAGESAGPGLSLSA